MTWTLPATMRRMPQAPSFGPRSSLLLLPLLTSTSNKNKRSASLMEIRMKRPRKQKKKEETKKKAAETRAKKKSRKDRRRQKRKRRRVAISCQRVGGRARGCEKQRPESDAKKKAEEEEKIAPCRKEEGGKIHVKCGRFAYWPDSRLPSLPMASACATRALLVARIAWVSTLSPSMLSKSFATLSWSSSRASASPGTLSGEPRGEPADHSICKTRGQPPPHGRILHHQSAHQRAWNTQEHRGLPSCPTMPASVFKHSLIRLPSKTAKRKCKNIINNCNKKSVSKL